MADYAPGLPDKDTYGEPTKDLTPGQLVSYYLQRHQTVRKPNNPHLDLRLGTPQTNLFSWAIPKATLPEPGEKRLAPQTPVHRFEYGNFQGRIGKGYGAGQVAQQDKGRAMITRTTPKTIHFELKDNQKPARYTLIKINTDSGRDWLLIGRSQGAAPTVKHITAADTQDAMDQVKAAANYVIAGDKVQGIGLRKTLHKLLDEKQLPGLAVNNPYDASVEVSLPEQSNAVLEELKNVIREHKGREIDFQPADDVDAERSKLRLSKAELNRLNILHNLQYRRSKAVQPGHRHAVGPMPLADLKADLIERYRLTPTITGGLKGEVPERARRQLTGSEFPYNFMLPENLVRSEEEADALLDKGAGSEDFKIADSDIHGKGAIATRDIPAGTSLGVIFLRQPEPEILEKYSTVDETDGYYRTKLGRYLNHQDDANTRIVSIGPLSLAMTKRAVKAGEELTTEYSQAWTAVYGSDYGIRTPYMHKASAAPISSFLSKTHLPTFRKLTAMQLAGLRKGIKGLPKTQAAGRAAAQAMRNNPEAIPIAALGSMIPIPAPTGGPTALAYLAGKKALKKYLPRIKKSQSAETVISETTLSKVAQTIKHIMLTGSPGSGKTTLSEELKQKLNLPVVHLDHLPSTKGHAFPGTEEAVEHIPTLTEPHIVEGAQVLGFPKKLLKGHDVRLLEPERDTLEDRLIARGWTTAKGEDRRGEESRRAAKLLVTDFLKMVEEFKEKHPDYQSAQSNAPETVPQEIKDDVWLKDEESKAAEKTSEADDVKLQFVDPEGVVKAACLAEIADTPALRRRGLSYRGDLPEGRGMFFDKVGAYWMKDVNFDLDILFLDKEGTVLEKQHMPMLKESTDFRPLYVPTQEEAAHALELPAGWFEAQGLTVGDTITVLNTGD
jgi:uncharacterized membrane protein (UPF0127 family)/acylphosphatase